MGRKPIWPPRPHIHRRDNIECVSIRGTHYPLGEPGSDEAKREYARIIAEFTAAGTASKRKKHDEPLIVEVAGLYLDRMQRRDRCESERARQAMSTLVSLYGTKPVSAFGPIALETCRDQLNTNGRSRSYVNRLTNHIIAAWKFAVAKELTTVEQWQALKTLGPLRIGETTAPERDPVMPCNVRDVEATIPFLSSRVAAMVRLQMLTGARPSEICRMRVGEIHRDGKVQLARGKVIDLSSFGVWVYSPEKHKKTHMGKERHLILGPQAREVLTPWLDGRAPEQSVFSPSEERAERFARKRAARKSKVQPSQVSRRLENPKRSPGDCFQVSSYYHAIQKACDLADAKAREASPDTPSHLRLVERWTPYQLRHLMATEIREEQDLEAAQAVLGHDNPDTTLIYALRSFRKAAEVIARMG